METVLIDTFMVPAEVKAVFLEQARQANQFIRTLPGFVEGFVYEQTGSDSPYAVVTVAVWRDQDAFEQAKQAVAAENQRLGINRQATLAALNIQMTRSTYARSPY